MGHNQLSFEKLENAQLQKLFVLTQFLSTKGDEQNILTTILDELMQETGAEIGAFIYYKTGTEIFEPRIVKSFDGSDTSGIMFSSTVLKDVAASSEAVLAIDTLSDQKYQDARSVILNEIHAILAFPLIINSELYGIMYFDSRRNRQGFNESVRQFLSFFSVIASLALEQVLQKEAYEKENVVLKNQLEKNISIPQIVGQSLPMQELFQLIHKVSQSDVSVIISGESGTGKDLVARAIHDMSDRKDKPFIAQYIGNIPNTLVESELFGYKKGAFTGANSDKAGLFEAADGGTLFLDEIGDLSPELQVKLLRVLQNQEIRRLGENTVRKVDARILAATNHDLAELVKIGSFREDLYYRLNVINAHVPALRERKTDMTLLAKHFLKGSNLQLSKSAMQKIISYHWPGNVRQLDNILKRASILANTDRIEEDDIQIEHEEATGNSTNTYSGTLEEIKNMVIRQRLELFAGNKTHTAKSLDISLRSIQAKAKELDL